MKKNDTALNMLLPNKLYADAKNAAESSVRYYIAGTIRKFRNMVRRYRITILVDFCKEWKMEMCFDYDR